MKNQFFLKSVISHVIAGLLPEAVSKHSFFVNDVSPDLQFTTDENQVTAVVKKLLQEELLKADHACIRISAAVAKNQLLLTVHNKGPFALPLL